LYLVHTGCRRPIKMSLLCQLEMTPSGFPGGVGVTVRPVGDGEATLLEVLRDLDQKRLAIGAAGRLLGFERRQVFRLLKANRSESPVVCLGFDRLSNLQRWRFGDIASAEGAGR
jgi:hypothetical protein